ncbi:unnamed protein product [marine sediment metagenome]|uniref:DNA polymerase beta thumb domain-containing protein n=1 Tax=marine sediment metagenome TaxID=412755 RepID=X1P415_9ZZZZ
MELEKAKVIAAEVVKRLAPYCAKIEVAGSVRRQKPFPRDIDIVLIPSDPWNLAHQVAGLGPAKLMGNKLKRINYNGVQIDLYYATPETWATLLLIRTGSKESNIRLCTLAKKKGWHLAASGDGLFDENDRRIAGDTERSIFEALGVRYQPPEGRG